MIPQTLDVRTRSVCLSSLLEDVLAAAVDAPQVPISFLFTLVFIFIGFRIIPLLRQSCDARRDLLHLYAGRAVQDSELFMNLAFECLEIGICILVRDEMTVVQCRVQFHAGEVAVIQRGGQGRGDADAGED